MGFEIMMEIEAGGTSSKVSQIDEDGKVGPQIGGPASFNGSNVDAYMGDARRVAAWIEHKDLGRLTIGRYESAGVIQTIDLGGVGLAASPSFILLNGSFFLRGPQGQWYGTSWGAIGDPAAAQGRTELVRYDSPTWMGFLLSSSIAEAGDYWGAMLRYAGEFSGFRIAAGIGFEQVRDKFTPTAANILYDTANRPAVDAWGGGLSIMHVPTGLFVQGHYNEASFGNGTATDGLNAACTTAGAANCTSGYWGQSVLFKSDFTHWLVQGGIAKNWFGYGNTSIYGEYGKIEDAGATGAGGRNYAAPATGGTAVFGVTDTEMTIWGVGIAQVFDAAATTMYLGYRHFEADINCARNCLTGAGAPSSLATEDLHVVVGGVRLLF
jgi:hypothetical protein